MKTVGYFDKNDKTIWSYPFFSNKKEYRLCEIAATHAGFGHVQAGMATKIFVLILHVTGDQCQLWVWQELEIVSDAAIHPWEMHILYNLDVIVKYSVIHRLQLINSDQLCNKKLQSIWLVDNVMPLKKSHEASSSAVFSRVRVNFGEVFASRGRETNIYRVW